AGLAGGQTAEPPARPCQVLKAWRQPNGAMAYQVRAADTGEVLIVIENGPPRPVTTLPPTMPPPAAPATTGHAVEHRPVPTSDIRTPARGYLDRPYAAVPQELRTPLPTEESQPSVASPALPVPAPMVHWGQPRPTGDRPTMPGVARVQSAAPAGMWA